MFIQKCKNSTTNPFGVNIPLLRGDAEELIDTVIEENVKIEEVNNNGNENNEDRIVGSFDFDFSLYKAPPLGLHH